MFRIQLIFLLVVSNPVVLLAQNDSIPKDTLVKGLYWSYHDMVANRPFYTDSFRILYANNARQGTYRHPDLKEYYNKTKDRVEYVRKNGLYGVDDGDRLLGYCDGKQIFVSFNRFHVLQEYGAICLVNVKESGSLGEIGAAFGIVGYLIQQQVDQGQNFGKVDDWYIIDQSLGKVNPIHPIYLDPIFRKFDKELYKEFKKTKKPRQLETMLEFVVRFNQRNPIPR